MTRGILKGVCSLVLCLVIVALFGCGREADDSIEDGANFFVTELKARPLNAENVSLVDGPSMQKIYFEFCIQDRLVSSLNLSQTPFQVSLKSNDSNVSVMSPSQHVITLQDDGCGYFEQLVQVEGISSARWVPFEVSFLGMHGHYASQVYKRDIYLNFLKGSENFLWDGIRGAPPKAKSEKDKPALMIRQIKYTPIHSTFSILDYMNLLLRKQYLMRIQVLIDSRRDKVGGSIDSVNDESPYLEPVQGDFYLSYYVGVHQKNLSKNSSKLTYLAGDDHQGKGHRVRVVNGWIQTDLNLDFQFGELPLANGRVTLYLVLKPADPNSGIRPTCLSFPFYPGKNHVTDAWAKDEEISSGVEWSEVAQLENHHRNFEAMRIRSLDPNESIDVERHFALLKKHYSVSDSPAHLRDFFQSNFPALYENKPTHLAEALCAVLYEKTDRDFLSKGLSKITGGGTDYEKCISHPHQYYQSTPFYFISDVKEYRQSGTDFNQVTVKATILKEFRKGHSISGGLKDFIQVYGYIDSSAGGKVFGNGAVAGVQANAGAEGFYTEEWSSGDNRRNRREVNNIKEFDVDHFQFEIYGKSLQCILIEALKEESKDRHRYLHCDPSGLSDRWVSEDYYFLRQNTLLGNARGIMRDTFSLDQQTYSIAIRGQAMFNSFRQLLEDSTRTVALVVDGSLSSADEEMRQVYQNYSATHLQSSSAGGFPGVVLEK